MMRSYDVAFNEKCACRKDINLKPVDFQPVKKYLHRDIANPISDSIRISARTNRAVVAQFIMVFSCRLAGFRNP